MKGACADLFGALPWRGARETAPLMAKLLLLSVLIAPIVIPSRAANLKNPRVGLKKTLVNMAVFNAVYLFAIMYIYSRL
jgi:hypothetical protein